MTLEMVFYYLILWSVIGFIAFCAYVFAVFRTGLVYTARKQDGTLKEHIPLSGYLNMLILLISIVGFQCLANYFGLVRENIVLSFFSLFLLNFGHYIILFVFDSVIIDGLVLSVWRPQFLNLPDAIGRESMKKHILVSIPIGTMAGIGLTAMSTVISYFVLFRR
jgi:hypothetical protein